ncbi:hypothetical protein CERZMDRAFT_101194 [Cercospora zeae-maydis SCOH1-5]|uniref:Uncharacterized protein n=1 Tax=Cercospora zeae-maydis SCOH1-5 TaxID=717836 RepID=A0A6A6F7Q8_9PEZI|nr:hypothetical protein CERZMDRAFT_101194 [Cercospora zeae-maydis SCOH1-5]
MFVHFRADLFDGLLIMMAESILRLAYVDLATSLYWYGCVPIVTAGITSCLQFAGSKAPTAKGPPLAAQRASGSGPIETGGPESALNTNTAPSPTSMKPTSPPNEQTSSEVMNTASTITDARLIPDSVPKPDTRTAEPPVAPSPTPSVQSSKTETATAETPATPSPMPSLSPPPPSTQVQNTANRSPTSIIAESVGLATAPASENSSSPPSVVPTSVVSDEPLTPATPSSESARLQSLQTVSETANSQSQPPTTSSDAPPAAVVVASGRYLWLPRHLPARVAHQISIRSSI